MSIIGIHRRNMHGILREENLLRERARRWGSKSNIQNEKG